MQWTNAVSLSLHVNGQGYTCLFTVTSVLGCGKSVNTSDPTDAAFLRLNGINIFTPHPLRDFLQEQHQSFKDVHQLMESKVIS